MFVFGSGVLIGTPAWSTTPTPINFGLVQEVSLDISTTLKPLYGQYNFPVAIGAGTKKVTGKAKVAKLSGVAFGSLAFGVMPTVGQTMSQFGEVHAVPASTPWQVTVTNAATFVADQGVVYASSGLPLQHVTTPAAVGQYSVATATGIYTFYTGDASANILISYTYNVAASGENVPVVQALLGSTINFSANLFASDPTTGKQFSIWVYNCVMSKISMGTKIEDFVVPDLEFECYANAAGQVLTFNFGDSA